MISSASFIKASTSEFKISHSTAQKVYEDALGLLTRAGEVSPAKLRDVLEMARETGQDNPVIPPPESMLDFSFLKEAQRELVKVQ